LPWPCWSARHWLQPDSAGRIAFALLSEQRFQVDALRQAQRRGASAFAICPEPPALPASPELQAAFSAARFPYEP